MQEGLDEEGSVEECGRVLEKNKRRLGVDQVKSLEKNFEVENKLERQRKVKLAKELGLQPTQVAVWFQNRRARSKTKNLERDSGLLKANYDALKRNYETLQCENEALINEIKELRSKQIGSCKSEGNDSEKQDATVSDEEKCKLGTSDDSPSTCDQESGTKLNFVNFQGEKNGLTEDASYFCDFKDGSSDCDDSSDSTSFVNSILRFSDLEARTSVLGDASKGNFELEYVKLEEHDYLDEESCSSLFSDDQNCTLCWYLSEEWK